MSFVNEVAEAKCQQEWVMAHPGFCQCGGSGLRWPQLSRVPRYSYEGSSDRAPDVTLEKVLELLA